MKIEKLAEDIEKTEEIAKMVLDEINPATRGAWGGAIEDAKVRMKDLRRLYGVEVCKNSAAIFLFGSKEKVVEFSELAIDEKEGFVVDANALYARLAHQVMVTLPDNRAIEWAVAQTYRLHTTIQEVMHEMGIAELPMPDRTEAPVVKTMEEVTAHIRKIVRAACGDSLNKLYVEEQLIKQAIEIRYTGVVVPVVVTGAEENEVYDLGRMFGQGAKAIYLTDDVEASVETLREYLDSANTRPQTKEAKTVKTEQQKKSQAKAQSKARSTLTAEKKPEENKE